MELARKSGAGPQAERAAKLKGSACVEDIDYRANRGLDKAVMPAWAKHSAWVRNHENVFVIGPCGVGKSFLAIALARKPVGMATQHSICARLPCRANWHWPAPTAAYATSSHDSLASMSWSSMTVPWLSSMETERREVWEVCEDRYQTRSTILTSQLPVSHWHEQIGARTIATASSTAWCAILTASRCAESPCVRSETRHAATRTTRSHEFGFEKTEPYPATARTLSSEIFLMLAGLV